MFPKLVIVGPDGDRTLARVPLAAGPRNEAWLRDFLLAHPDSLPAAEIDRAFADPIPVCRELSTPAGPIDAVFVNQDGALTIVECKLWRNPQARREVVGQILDYAKELARWRYEDLQREVSRVLKRAGTNALFDLVRARHPDTDEATFVDGVGRSLAEGRFLLVVAGDGIREGTETIVRFMQDHSGLRFTFGLVEMAGYELPDGRLLVQPRVLARTQSVERIVVRVAEAVADWPRTPTDAGAGVEEDAPSPMRRGRDPEAVASDRAFWEAFARSVRFDDPTQSPPRRGGFGWARIDLGVPNVWITVYRARSQDLIGVYLAFQDEAAWSLLDALALDRPAIDEALLSAGPGGETEWGATPPRQRWIAWRLVAHGAWGPDQDDDHRRKLATMANAFVNVFRPRLLRLIEDRG